MKEAWAGAKPSTVLLHTLHISHAGTSQDFYLVNAPVAYVMTLEDDTEHTFEPVGFKLALPSQNVDGVGELGFEIDNVDARISEFIDSVLYQNSKVILKYRIYLASDLTTPQNTPLALTLSDAQITAQTVTARAAFADIVNLKFLTQNYTRGRFKSLGNS